MSCRTLFLFNRWISFSHVNKRFGCGLTDMGQINLKNKIYECDYRPIEEDCDCSTCRNYTRAYLNSIVTLDTVACHLLSVHNISYQMRLMKSMQDNIKKGQFPEFVKSFMAKRYPERDYPMWIVEALAAVNIHLEKSSIVEEKSVNSS